MKSLFFFLLVLMNLLWAATYVAFKALTPWLTAGGVATLRYGLAAVLFAILWPWLPGRAPRGFDVFRTVLMGAIVFALGNRLMVAGVHRGQAADASVLMGLDPLITSLAAALFLREHITVQRWAGFALGLLGVVLLAQVWRPDFQWPGLAANLLILGSFICETPFSVMGKGLSARASLFKVTALAVFSGALVNGLIDGRSTLAAALRLPPRAWMILLYLALICTVVGYCLWLVVIRETEVNVTALTIFVQPVAGVVLAVAWLGEPLHWGQLWGSVAIVAGLLVAFWTWDARVEGLKSSSGEALKG